MTWEGSGRALECVVCHVECLHASCSTSLLQGELDAVLQLCFVCFYGKPEPLIFSLNILIYLRFFEVHLFLLYAYGDLPACLSVY